MRDPGDVLTAIVLAFLAIAVLAAGYRAATGGDVAAVGGTVRSLFIPVLAIAVLAAVGVALQARLP